MLGKIGPHYERPEYRPPQTPPDNEGSAGRLQERPADRRTLSTRNTDVPVKTVAALPTGKVTLDLARDITRTTAGLIGQLAPRSTTQEPHNWLPSRLMTPVYA